MPEFLRVPAPDEARIAANAAQLIDPVDPTYPTLTPVFSDDWDSGSIAAGTRAADVGGNQTVVDGGGDLSLSGGRVEVAAAVALNDPGIVATTGRTRALGLALVATIRAGLTTADWSIGWAASTVVNSTLLRIREQNNDTFGIIDDGSSLFLTDYLQPGLDYTVAVVCRATGAYYFVRGGRYTEWTLLWVGNAGATATLYPAWNSMATVGGQQIGPWKALTLPSWFVGADDYALATYHKATTVAGDTAAAASGDALVEHTITAATGVTQTLQFRKSGASNYFEVRCNQGASTVDLYKVVGGVASLVATAAQTWTNATQYRVVVIAARNKMQVVVAGSRKLIWEGNASYAHGEVFNATATGVRVSHAGAHLTVWRRDYPELPLAGASLTNRIFSYGDSKTYGTGDSTPPLAHRNGYQPLLTAALATATGQPWGEVGRIARPGYDSTDLRALIAADLASQPDHLAPTWVLVNISINDLLTDTATFTANLGAIADAFHRKWSRAKVGFALVWSTGGQDNLTELTALNNAIVAVALARMPWAFVGPDERAFLPGGDNGATNTTDGVHPNRTGYTLTATAWQAAMGY